MDAEISRFNIRVYGIMLNDQNEVLVSDEIIKRGKYTKFPGGGLNLGEGVIDCLRREFREEAEVEIIVKEHIYTTDFFQKSFFDDSQVISIYYLVKSLKANTIRVSKDPFDTANSYNLNQNFRWVKIEDLNLEPYLTLPIDKKVVHILNMLRMMLTNMI